MRTTPAILAWSFSLHHIHGFCLAVTLLTRFPIPSALMPHTVTGRLQSLSALYYPLVGALIAVVLVGVAKVLHHAVPDFFVSAVVVCVWVLVTGALHLEGLADSMDAWAVCHKRNANLSAILAIFKDPAAGPFAVVGIVLTVLLKIAAVMALLGQSYVSVVFFAAVTARLAAIVFMATTTYVSVGGIAEGIQLSVKNRALIFWYFFMLVASVLCFGLLPVFIIVCVVGAVTFLWRRFWVRHIEGYVGDCVGALIEFIELAVLLVFVFIFSWT